MDCECFCHSMGKDFCEACWQDHDLEEEEALNMYALSLAHKNVKTYTATLVRIARPEDFVN